jgi:hypothetical protein
MTALDITQSTVLERPQGSAVHGAAQSKYETWFRNLAVGGNQVLGADKELRLIPPSPLEIFEFDWNLSNYASNTYMDSTWVFNLFLE